MPQTIERLHVAVDGVTYPLAPLERVDDVKGAIIQAVRAGAGFVDLTLDGGQRLSVLVVPTTAIVITTQTVRLDLDTADRHPNDRGDLPVAIDYDDGWPFDLI